MALGDSIGKNAAVELHHTVDAAIPEAQAAGVVLIKSFATEVTNVLSGSLTQAAGSLETVLSSLPEATVSALEGLTVTTSPIVMTFRVEPVTVTVSRSQQGKLELTKG